MAAIEQPTKPRDTLFDPMLPRLVLPIRNSAVLRIQVALATMDWAAEQLRSRKPPCEPLAGPSSIGNPKYGAQQREAQLAAADLLEKVLRNPSLQYSLQKWITEALKLPNNVVSELLWHPPRPVILAAMPTLIRRLRAEWAVATARRSDPREGRPGQ